MHDLKATQQQARRKNSLLLLLLLFGGTACAQSAADRTFPELLWNFRGMFLLGTWVTITISVLSMLLASSLGLCLALTRLYGNRFFSRAALAYIEFVRGTPLLVQLWFIYYGLPAIPFLANGLHALRLGLVTWGLPDMPWIEDILKLSPLTAAILGVGLNYAAYEAEIYRAGIMAIPRAQTEAALVLGMTRRQTLRLVVLPQALRLVIPPVTNDFVALFKDTSIVSIVAVTELTKTFQSAALSTQRYMEFALVTALIYFAISYPLSKFARYLESRIHPHHDYDFQPV